MIALCCIAVHSNLIEMLAYRGRSSMKVFLFSGKNFHLKYRLVILQCRI